MNNPMGTGYFRNNFAKKKRRFRLRIAVVQVTLQPRSAPFIVPRVYRTTRHLSDDLRSRSSVLQKTLWMNGEQPLL